MRIDNQILGVTLKVKTRQQSSLNYLRTASGKSLTCKIQSALMSYRLQMNLSLAHNSEDQVKENLGEISQRQNSLVQRMTTFHPWTGYIWSPCLKKDQPKKSTHRNTIDWERQPTRNCIFCLNYYANYLQIFFKCHLLPKNKLTVSTQKSILNTRNYWELRIEEDGSGIKDRGLRIEGLSTYFWVVLYIYQISKHCLLVTEKIYT